ncbi:unnamed protein product [Closterium sp. NIES-53]
MRGTGFTYPYRRFRRRPRGFLKAGTKRPTVARLLATAVTDLSFESAAASALVTELLDFAAACRLDYASALFAESMPASPPSVGGECALGTDILEDRKEDFECLAAVVPRFASLLHAPEGDPDAPDIPTPRSYAEAITGPYSSQWQAAMDAEMAFWKSTCTYVDEVPPPGVNIVDGMWIFRVKRPPGSPPAFKACYVARGFSQRQGIEYFQTFSPTPKMTTLRVLLHVAAQRNYELHSLDFSTAFLQGSLHEEIWLRRPPGFTGSFPTGTQWSLRRPVYGLRQAPREWHDTLMTTLAALGFVPSTADPSLFLRTDTSLPPFYVLVYVDDLVFATADTEALTLVKSELQKRHICTDLGEVRSYLGLQITRDRARRTITLTQSHMVHQSVELSGPYPELVGCLMYLMTCTRPDLAYPLSLLAHYVAPSRHRKVHWDAAKRVLRYLCSMSGMGLVLGGHGPVVLTGHADASWVDDSATQRLSQVYTFSLGSGSVSWRSTRSSSVLSSSYEAEIYAGAMAAQELRWLTYLLTDLGEQPRSPPVLYVENKAMIALCQEHRLEHRTKHIALRYFLARELQQRGQLRLAYVATRANTADVFTKALPPGDHQRFVTVLGLEHRLEHRTKHIALRYFLARELQQRGQLRLAYLATKANTTDVFIKALPPGDHQRFVTVLACFAFLDWSCDHFPHPYFMRNHLGSYECKMCLTLHNNKGNYLTHTQGKRHQQNLAKRGAKEVQEAPRRPALRTDRVPVEPRRREGSPTHGAAGSERFAASMNEVPWRNETFHGTEGDHGRHQESGAFRSPEEGERRRDERGRWHGREEPPRGQGRGSETDREAKTQQADHTQEEVHKGRAEGEDKDQEYDDDQTGVDHDEEEESTPADEIADSGKAAAEEPRMTRAELRAERLDQRGERRPDDAPQQRLRSRKEDSSNSRARGSCGGRDEEPAYVVEECRWTAERREEVTRSPGERQPRRHGEDPTEAFLEQLHRQFHGHTAERIKEFQEFRRGRAESLLTYCNRLINVAEDVRCSDSSLLISKFLGGLDGAPGGGLRMRVYELGAEARLDEVFDLAEKVELAQRRYEAYLPRPAERSRRLTWAAAMIPEGGGRTDGRGEAGVDTRTCHRCGQLGHIRRDCKNCDGCGKPGHRRRECPDAARCEICKKRGHEAKDCYQREGGARRTPEELHWQISRLEEMGLRSGGKDGRREQGRKESERGQKPGEPALEQPPARHPQERLACQTSVLLLEGGAMEVEVEKVKTAIIDTGAQGVMLGKGMAERLGLMAPETHMAKGMLVMTAEEGEPQWMPCTRVPIEVTLLPGGEHETNIRMKCGISESEDFDVLVGTELVFAVGMTICTWTERVEFCTRYWKEGPLGQLPVRFVKVEPKRAYQASDWQQPICLLELFGGIGAGLSAVVRSGMAVRRWIYVEKEPVVRRMAEHHAWKLQAEFPELLSGKVVQEAMGGTLHDVRDITVAEVASWGMSWQNVVPARNLQEEIDVVKRAPGKKVHDILEPGWTPAPLCRKGYHRHYPCNQVGQDRRALPTLVAYAGAVGYEWAMGKPGPGMVYDHRRGRWEEPPALERELAMGMVNATAAPGVSEADRRRALGNAMDGHMMRWLVQRMWRVGRRERKKGRS